MANKIYAVKKGLVPGLYSSWDECKLQVDGYSGAEYKSFKSSQLEEAIDYIGIANTQIESKQKQLTKNISISEQKLVQSMDPGFGPSHSVAYTMDTLGILNLKKSKAFINPNIVDVYVDGSFKSGNYSYAYVVVKDNQVIHSDSGVGKDPGAATMNNVAGELSAAMNAICWARDNGYTCRIFHDYEGIGKWARKEWKCKNKYTKAYAEFIDSNHGIVSEFIHVYGHTGNVYNELADKLAGEAFGKAV